MKPNRVYVCCPTCEDVRGLEVVCSCSGAIFTQQVSEVGIGGYFEVLDDEFLVHSVDTHRFQCNHCGHVFADNLNEYEEWAENNFDVSELWG